MRLITTQSSNRPREGEFLLHSFRLRHSATGTKCFFCATSRWFFSTFEEFDAPVYSRIHQEQIVTGMTPQHRVENLAVQEIHQIHIVEQIPEQIVDSTGLVIPQFKHYWCRGFCTTSRWFLSSFGRVLGETTQYTFANPTVQEQ